MFVRSLLLFFAALPITWAQAGEGHDPNHGEADSHSHHHHDHADAGAASAHVHGEVMLQLALQGNDLQMQLESPAMNIVGFEHRASTPKQIESVAAAEAKLRQVTNWLTLQGGECQAINVVPDLNDVLPEAEAGGDQHGHADIHVDAQFRCSQPGHLRGLQIALFGDFPGVEKITVQWVFNGEAGERSITGDNPTLRFDD